MARGEGSMALPKLNVERLHGGVLAVGGGVLAVIPTVDVLVDLRLVGLDLPLVGLDERLVLEHFGLMRMDLALEPLEEGQELLVVDAPPGMRGPPRGVLVPGVLVIAPIEPMLEELLLVLWLHRSVYPR